MPRDSAARKAPSECPVCGEAVPSRATSCPHCGADERTGWNEENTRHDGLDLPDSAYSENGDDDAGPRRRSRSGPHPLWLVVGGLLLLWFAYLALSPF